MSDDSREFLLQTIRNNNINEQCLYRAVQNNLSVDVTQCTELLDGNVLNSGVTKSYNRWSPLEDGVTLVWRDLSVYAYSGSGRKQSFKKIINNVSGAVKKGSFVALMGSSGAGKSTLMSALSYRMPVGMAVEGEILVNGRPIGNYMHTVSGFMHQEDLFIGSLTVLEHMNIMARLKLDRRTTNIERNKKVKSLLKNLGLLHCLHTRIGLKGNEKVLSGGEKKRLAFATELLTNPPLLFCDEPTTGLDSYSAQKIINMMNIMAAQGKTIICTIHQPSSELFALFNQLILVADGRIAFVGTTDQALDFFDKQGYICPASYNPADFFIHTLAITPGFEDTSKQTIKKMCDQFAVSDSSKQIDLVVQYEFHMKNSMTSSSTSLISTKVKQPFWWTKLYWLTYRYILDVVRNPTVQTLRVIQKVAIAIMVGLCYLGTIMTSQTGIQSVQGALFLLVSENTFSPMYAVLAIFPQDFPLFLREYHSGLYSPGMYYLSKMIALIPGLIFEPLLFVMVCYWLAGLRNTLYAFSMTALTTILTMNVSTACGVFFSNAFDSVALAMAYLVPFDYILMITSGVFVKLSSLPTYIGWLKYMSWLMYSNEAMSIVQWDGISNITCDSINTDFPCLRNGDEVLDKYSFSASHLSRDLINIIILYVIFHILGFLCLLNKAKKR